MERMVRAIVSAFDRNLSLDSDQREVLEYALYHVLITVATVLGVSAIGAMTGSLKESTVALATGALFRWSTGGAHLSRPTRCVVLSVIAPALAGLLAKMIGGVPVLSSLVFLYSLVATLALISIVIIQVYAPADTENKPIRRKDRQRHRRNARLSLLVWSCICLVMAVVQWPTLIVSASFGLVWQMLSVTPPGYTVFGKIDTAFERVGM